MRHLCFSTSGCHSYCFFDIVDKSTFRSVVCSLAFGAAVLWSLLALAASVVLGSLGSAVSPNISPSEEATLQTEACLFSVFIDEPAPNIFWASSRNFCAASSSARFCALLVEISSTGKSEVAADVVARVWLLACFAQIRAIRSTGPHVFAPLLIRLDFFLQSFNAPSITPAHCFMRI